MTDSAKIPTICRGLLARLQPNPRPRRVCHVPVLRGTLACIIASTGALVLAARLPLDLAVALACNLAALCTLIFPHWARKLTESHIDKRADHVKRRERAGQLPKGRGYMISRSLNSHNVLSR